MKIAIDARFLGPKGSGVGRYIEKLLENLEEIDGVNEYHILLNSDNLDLFRPKNDRFKKVLADAKWFSVKEQLLLPRVLASLRPDLVHFPQYNVPILYRGKFVVTIHDLIKSEFAGKSASTKGPLVYWTKQIGYELAVRVAARFSRKIIVPTNVIKEKISKNLNVLPEKIQVTYEAADEKFFEWGEKNFLKHEIDEVLAKYYIRRPFIIYVGNSYPYKNLNRLVDALKVLPKDLNLVNPCSRSVFYERLTTYAKEQDLADRVILPGFVPDDDLAILYRAAEAYVFPSLSEGFGIPALEAMASKLPVACSDIPVFHEVCGDNAIYFDPRDTADMASKIGQLINDSKLKERMVREGLERAHQFSWRKMAAQTLQIYEGAAR